MAFTDPIRESIIAKLAEVVGTVTVPGGYNTNIHRVFRTFRTPTLMDEIPYACVLNNAEDKEVANPLQFYANVLRVSVWVFTCFDIAAEAEADILLNRAVADVEKAILSEPVLQGGQVSGTLVDWLHIVASERRLFGQGASFSDGAEISIEIRYLHSGTDPYTGRS